MLPKTADSRKNVAKRWRRRHPLDGDELPLHGRHGLVAGQEDGGHETAAVPRARGASVRLAHGVRHVARLVDLRVPDEYPQVLGQRKLLYLICYKVFFVCMQIMEERSAHFDRFYFVAIYCHRN